MTWPGSSNWAFERTGCACGVTGAAASATSCQVGILTSDDVPTCWTINCALTSARRSAQSTHLRGRGRGRGTPLPHSTLLPPSYLPFAHPRSLREALPTTHRSQSEPEPHLGRGEPRPPAFDSSRILLLRHMQPAVLAVVRMLTPGAWWQQGVRWSPSVPSDSESA